MAVGQEHGDRGRFVHRPALIDEDRNPTVGVEREELRRPRRVIGDVGFDQPVLGPDFLQHDPRTHCRGAIRIEELVHDWTPGLLTEPILGRLVSRLDLARAREREHAPVHGCKPATAADLARCRARNIEGIRSFGSSVPVIPLMSRPRSGSPPPLSRKELQQWQWWIPAFAGMTETTHRHSLDLRESTRNKELRDSPSKRQERKYDSDAPC